MNPERRKILKAAAVSGAAALLPAPARAGREVVNDVSQLNPVEVADARRPRSTGEIQAALRAWSGAVSIGGARFSMGGQIAEPGSLHLDMRAMNRVVFLDPARRVIRVQAGIRWRDIQDAIDLHDLSVKIMQSYSNFTVGGAVSVNCHGRYVGRGPLVNSVRAVQLVTADSQVLELSRSENAELFRAVFGVDIYRHDRRGARRDTASQRAAAGGAGAAAVYTGADLWRGRLGGRDHGTLVVRRAVVDPVRAVAGQFCHWTVRRRRQPATRIGLTRHERKVDFRFSDKIMPSLMPINYR